MTGSLTTIARPYATAAFESALAKKALPQWEAFLKTAASVTLNPQVASLLENPKVTSQRRSELFCEVLNSILDEEKKNFICLLAENKRLPILPDVSELFIQLRDAYEKNIVVEVTSATPLDEQYKQKFVTVLTEKLKKRVTLQCHVDPDLLGGAMIRAGDTVLDGSVRGKLNRLIESL